MGKREVKKTGPRIVALDIETAPIEAYVWGLFDQNIAVNQIKAEWCLLSCAWQFDGEPMQYLDNRDQDGPRDDESLAIAVWEVLDEADIVIAQNGNSFDIRKLNARFAELGFTPPSPYRTVDTKLVAQKVFSFTSNRLEWLAPHLAGTEKQKHGKFPGFDLWREVLANNQDAWVEMEKYNRQDVKALWKLYRRLLPWMKQHPNMGQYIPAPVDGAVCPKCGSTNVQNRGKSYTTAGTYQRVHCLDCGGWSRRAVNLMPKEQRKALLRGE